jgi:hypothetical protein
MIIISASYVKICAKNETDQRSLFLTRKPELIFLKTLFQQRTIQRKEKDLVKEEII